MVSNCCYWFVAGLVRANADVSRVELPELLVGIEVVTLLAFEVVDHLLLLLLMQCCLELVERLMI